MPTLIPIAAPPESGGWSEIPADLRPGVVGGLRWTLWLALAGVPFSYATKVLLARLGPQPLAAYGLLLVYISYISAFLFLGGNAVAIRYLPALRSLERRNFLYSYCLVVAIGWAPWLLVAACFPASIHWLFAGLGGPAFALAMLALAPLPILFSLLLAALKGMLELAWAQWIYRGVTVGMFAGCAAFCFGAPAFFTAHLPWLLWGWYLALAAAGAAAAGLRL
ncbi:MAG: hypothetical protein ACRD1E_02805, partial [Terriglobales bacterium]